MWCPCGNEQSVHRHPTAWIALLTSAVHQPEVYVLHSLRFRFLFWLNEANLAYLKMWWLYHCCVLFAIVWSFTLPRFFFFSSQLKVSFYSVIGKRELFVCSINCSMLSVLQKHHLIYISIEAVTKSWEILLFTFTVWS